MEQKRQHHLCTEVGAQGQESHPDRTFPKEKVSETRSNPENECCRLFAVFTGHVRRLRTDNQSPEVERKEGT